MAKKVNIGTLLKFVDKEGASRLSLALGNKGKDPKYHMSVEVVVRDAQGKVVAKQVDGFLDLIDPRTEPDVLLQKGIVSEDVASRMKENVSKLHEKVRYSIRMDKLS